MYKKNPGIQQRSSLECSQPPTLSSIIFVLWIFLNLFFNLDSIRAFIVCSFETSPLYHPDFSWILVNHPQTFLCFDPFIAKVLVFIVLANYGFPIFSYQHLGWGWAWGWVIYLIYILYFHHFIVYCIQLCRLIIFFELCHLIHRNNIDKCYY